MSTSEIKLSNETRTVISRFHAKLEDGEKVLLWGRGKAHSPLKRTATFAILLIFILFFPGTAMWLLCQVILLAAPSFVFSGLWISVIAIELGACYAMFRCITGGISRWHVLTSQRLLRISGNGTVQTIANRAEVVRIEGSGQFVNLIVRSPQRQDNSEISICQVRGLPEIIGGQDPVWLISRK